MLDSKIKQLFDDLSSAEDKKRIETVNEIYEIYKNNEESHEYIINRLVKGLATVRPQPRKGFFNTFHHILQTLDSKALEATINKMKEHLFLPENKSLTKSEMTAIKLGSILAFDAITMSKRTKDIEKEALTHFFGFVLNLITDNVFGFISSEVLKNHFENISKKQFEKSKTLIMKELMQPEELNKNPQLLIMWLGFSAEQKKALKAASKTVPSLQANESVMAMLPALLKSCKVNHMLLIFNHLMALPIVPIIWKTLTATCLKSESDLKDKQIILFMAFEVLKPQPNSVISKLTLEQRQSLIDTIWTNDQFLNLFYKQLSSTAFDLNEMCVNFVSSLNKIENKSERPLLEYAFKKMMSVDTKLIHFEVKISQSFRLSYNLLRFVDDMTVCEGYAKIIKEFLEKSEKDQEKIYAFEELTSLSTKVPISSMDILLAITGRYNQLECTVSDRVVEAAKAAYLGCLETISITDFDRLKTLLSQAKSLCDTNLPMLSTLNSVLQYWESPAPQTKKRTASDRDKVIIDWTNPIDSMFVALQAHMCLYMMCQPFDEETNDTLDDLKKCLIEFKGSNNVGEQLKKKSRSSVTSNGDSSEKNWRLVLTDVLTLFMEQSCHYLRTLSVHVFKVLVVTGHCDNDVLELVKATIKDIDSEINGVDKKKEKEKHVEDEDMDEKDDDDSDASADSDSDDDSDSVDENKDNAMKARISAALSAMKADVDSDADDNCPDADDEDATASSDDDNKAGDKKANLKDKRFTITQLRQYRYRCLDLLDLVILHGATLSIRLSGFITFLQLATKNDSDTEGRLCKTVATFKAKYQPKEDLSAKDIVDNINRLISAVEGCHQTNNLVTAFSDIMITLLRIRKAEMAAIVGQFAPIIDNCITDKKNHSIKAVFMSMFERVPEIGWAFHGQVLAHAGDDQTRLVQYRAFEILRRILTNPALKTAQHSVTTAEVTEFIASLVEKLRAIIADLDLSTNHKHASIVIGLLIDCVKVCPSMVSRLDEIVAKIMAPRTSKPSKEFKKIINKFVSALNLVRSTNKD